MPDTRTARIELSDAGIVIVRIRNGARQSVSDASENVSTAIATRDGQRRPILVDIRKAAPLAADVRRMYQDGISLMRSPRSRCSSTPTRSGARWATSISALRGCQCR